MIRWKKSKNKNNFETPEYIAAMRQRQRIKNRIIFFVVLTILILSIGLLSWMEYTGATDKFKGYVNEKFIGFTSALGLNLEHVYLFGVEHLSDKDVLALVPSQGAGEEKIPIFSVPIIEVKQKLEKLGWVKEVQIERHLPNTLYVKVVERVPAAIWQYNKNLRLIDRDGVFISDKDIGQFKKLPVLVGEGADKGARELFDMIESEPRLSAMVTSAIRVGNRRWNIRFASGVEAKLPEEDMKSAWKRLADLQNRRRILNREINGIDMRFSGKVFLKVPDENKDSVKK